jgi:hypothetical protein
MASDCLLARSRFTAKNTPINANPTTAEIIPRFLFNFPLRKSD